MFLINSLPYRGTNPAYLSEDLASSTKLFLAGREVQDGVLRKNCHERTLQLRKLQSSNVTDWLDPIPHSVSLLLRDVHKSSER